MVIVIQLSLLGKGRGGGPGHTAFSSWNGNEEGRWSWPYKAFFAKKLSDGGHGHTLSGLRLKPKPGTRPGLGQGSGPGLGPSKNLKGCKS